VYEEKCSDELWLVVKRLSNLAIAGSPRNMFWHDLRVLFREVEILEGDGGRKPTHSYQTPNARMIDTGSQYYGEISWYERATTQTID
jgi:hypothetical protein